MDLHFSLNSESLAHNEFLEQKAHTWNDAGEIEIPLNFKHGIFKAIFGNDGIPKSQEHDYHCLPLCVKLSAIHSTFPISMQISLRSKLPHVSPRVILQNLLKDRRSREFLGSAQQQQNDMELPSYTAWSNVSGISSSGEESYYTVLPQQNTPRDRNGDFLYIAPEPILNHPDFSRLITMNFQQLREDYAKSRIDEHFYRLEGEDVSRATFKTESFWFFVE